MIALVLIAIVIVTAVILLVSYARHNYGILENSGFPVLQPTLFLGSVPNLHKEIQHLEDIKRFKKYGRIWGVYEGRSPQVHVCDPELIRLILVKDFDHFSNRRDMDFGSPTFNEIMDFLPDEKWKTVRSLLSPLFTTAKLRGMSGTIASHAKEFAEDLKLECTTNTSVKFDCRKRLSTWLIDMFSRTTMGVTMADSKDPDNEFASSFRKLVGEDVEVDWVYTLTLSFPFLTRFAPAFFEAPISFINSTIRHILESRRTDNIKKPNDFVDFLNDLWFKLESPEFQRLGITENTIISQAVNFFLGGYETSSTTLTHLFYYLANDPEAQAKLQSELDFVFIKFGGEFNTEGIRDENSSYLTACLNEALRLAPPLFRPERICTKDWSHNGISIKTGTAIMINTWPAHRIPEIYEDPEEFKPERFLPENKSKIHPYAFNSFGHGPRNCIGIRFAYESIKLFTSYFFHSFSLRVREDTALCYKPGSMMIVGFKKPVYVDVVRRGN